MDSLIEDPLWESYKHAAEEHRRASQLRTELDAEIARNYSPETLEAWDNAHRDEERCFEHMKAAERAVRAKFANL